MYANTLINILYDTYVALFCQEVKNRIKKKIMPQTAIKIHEQKLLKSKILQFKEYS